MVVDGIVVDTPLSRTESMVMDIPVNRASLFMDGMVMDTTLGGTGSMVMDIPVNRLSLFMEGMVMDIPLRRTRKYGHGYTSKQAWSWLVYS